MQLEMYCDPQTKETLELIEGNLVNPRSGRVYPIRDGIPLLLGETELSGDNLKYQQFYDKIAPFYNLSNKLYFYFKFGGERQYREQFLHELEIQDKSKVMEISVGTGDNLPYLPQGIDFFGLDISFGMLKACVRNLKKWKRDAHMVQANAEAVPFVDNSFDVVYHVGGINFFNDKDQAIREMIRIAKPGSKIMIVDETEKLASGTYERTPFVRRYYQKRTITLNAPVDHVPAEMQDISVKEICDGLLYCLTFRKP